MNPAVSFLRALFATVRERSRHGPAFPRWSFKVEVLSRVLKFQGEAWTQMPLDERRRVNDRAGDQQAKLFRKRVKRDHASVGGVGGEWFVPRGSSPERTVLYLHGGGFTGGSSRTHAELIMRLACAADVRIFAPNYALAPEHKHPRQLQDALAVYRGLLEAGVRPEDLVVMGDSAGGTLTVLLLAALRDSGERLPSRAALLSPWVDLAERAGSMQENTRFDWATPSDFDYWANAWLASGTDAAEASPINVDLRGFPALRVEVGTAEMLLDQVRAFAARAREAGVEVDFRELPGMVHNSYLLAAWVKECEASVQSLASWIRGDAR